MRKVDRCSCLRVRVVCFSMITISYRRFRAVMSEDSHMRLFTSEEDVVLTDDVCVCSSMITTSFRRFPIRDER